jgi:peptide/nickel transport system permease protein
VLRLFTMVGLALPGFWLGLLILIALVRLFNWLPPLRVVGLMDDPLRNLAQFIWPAIAIAVHSSAVLARIIRASMLEVLGEDYIRTARSKGLRERVVVARHAFKNSLPPVLATLGIIVASVLTGTIVIETVFNLPGLGRYLIDSISGRDYPVLQAMIVLTALLVILINLTVDIVQGLLDPRVSSG